MRKLINLLPLSLLGLLWLAFAPVAYADVSFYGQCDYKGPSVTLDAGEYSAADLAKVGIPQDAIQSIIVPDGFIVTVHEDDGFQGRYGTLRSNDSCLEDDNFHNVISSIKIVAPKATFGNIATDLFGNAAASVPADRVSVYDQCNYSGRAVSLLEGQYNTAQLNELGIRNNTLAALKVPAGYEVELFINDFHLGRSGTAATDNPCLTGAYSEAVSSVIVKKVEPAAEPVAALFQHCNYRGGSVELPVGDFNANALRTERVQDNSVSSIKVAPGYRVTIYDGPSFDVKRLVLSGDDDCLDNNGFNEQLSSIVIEYVGENTNTLNAPLNSSSKPAFTSANTTNAGEANAKLVQTGLACVQRYVERNACDARRYQVIENLCKLTEVEELSDGYLKGHIEAGNCRTELWDELVQRTSNPNLR